MRTEKYYYFWVMKIKAWIYFICIIAGIIMISTAGQVIPMEYAYSFGIILLMYGLYKVSVSWKPKNTEGDENEGMD